jgi:hypothetical protein
MNNSIGTIIADIDNDLKYEILFSNASGTYNLELNDQGTNIQKISNFNSANASSYGHFTSKIDNEIAIIDDSDKQLKIVNLSYSIIRSTKIFADAVGWKVQSCLFNGSSLNDLLLYKESQQKLFYVINDGSTFVNYSIAATPIEKVSCDYFNNDEYMDIIIRNQMGFIVFLNNNGLFDPLNNITSENVPNINADRSSFVVGDINKDLKKEIIYTGSSAGVLAENGNSLILVQNLSEQYNYSSVTLYDYDNDNDLDLFIIGAQGGYKHTILENKINVIDSNETKPDANLSYYRDGNIFTFIITNKTRYEDNYLLGIGSESVKEDVLSSKIPFSLSITSQKSIATPIRYVGNLGRKKEFNLTLSSNSDLYFNLYAVSPLNKVHFLQQLHYQPAGCVMINNTAWQIISSCDINATSTPTSITINEGGTLKVNSDTYFNLNDILEIQNRGTLNITKSLNKNGTMHIYNYANSSINVFNSLLNVSYLDCNNCSFNITNSSVLGGIMYIRDTNSTFNDCVLENLTLEYMNLTLNNCSYNHSTESDSKITQRWWLSFFNNSNVLVNISAGSYDLLNQVVNTGSRVLLENKSYTITLSKPLSETTTSVLNLVDNINYDLYLSPGYPEFTLNPYTTNFSNYSIEELVSLTGFTVGNSNSSITFLSNVDVRGRNFTALVNNFYNSVFVNDTFYNSYAIIAIRNLPYNKMPLVYRDGALCGSNCTIISYNSALLNFSVGGFSTYQAMANSGINVSTYSQRGINIQNIEFEVRIDYKNISTSGAVHNADCDLYINGYTYRANESNRTGQYYVYKVNLSSGTHLYIANCSSDAAENQTTSGTITVYPEGNYLIGKNVTQLNSHEIIVYNGEMYDSLVDSSTATKYNFTTEQMSNVAYTPGKKIFYDQNNDGIINLSEVMTVTAGGMVITP